MKKGTNSVISITLVILITVVVAGVFFFWITTLQSNSQGTTYLAQRNLLRNALAEADELVDAFYTTVEEGDTLAFADAKTTICNTGSNILDLTAQKSIQVTEVGTDTIVCAESVLDTSCLDSKDYIIAGLADTGSTASAVPAAIVYSDDGGTTWNEAVGVSGSSTEDINALSQLAVSTVTGESPNAFWSASDSSATGNLAWAEDIEGPWFFEDTGTREAYSSSIDSTNNVLYIGADDFAGTGASILRLTTDDSTGTTDVQITTLQDTASDADLSSGSATDYDGIFALYTDDDVGGGIGLYLAGTGIVAGASDGASGALGNILFSTSSDFSGVAEATVPDSYRSINDFAETSGRIYASTSSDAAPALAGTTTADVIYEDKTDLPPFLGTGWTTTDFGNPGGTGQIATDADINAIIDDPSNSGNEFYAAYTLTSGVSSGDSKFAYYDPALPVGNEWLTDLQTWTSSTVYDVAIDTTNQRFYAAVGNDATGSEAAEIWQSGPNYDDDSWTLVYSNTDRGAAVSLSIVSKCNKHNPTCIGCTGELQPGECGDIQLVFEDSNCELNSYSPETLFEIVFTIGRYFTKVFNFQKLQDPADHGLFSGAYTTATSPPGPTNFFFFLNATRRNNGTETNLTAQYNFTGTNRTLLFDWRINTTAGPGAGTPASVAVLNLPFNNDTQSSTFVKDYSTFANHGTKAGSATWRNSSVCNLTTLSGGCYQFAGSGQYVNIPHDASHNLAENFSVEAWFNTSSIVSACSVTGQTVLSRSSSGLGNLESFTLFLQETGVIFWRIKNDTISGAGHTRVANYYVNSSPSQPSYNDSNWHQLVGVYNGTTALLYYDGVLVNSSHHTIHDGANQGNKPIGIGREGSLNQRCFNGYIDNVKIYNTTLNRDTVSLLYNSGSPRYNLTHSDLTVPGQNWTVAVTPGNGSVDNTTLISNGVVVTGCQFSAGCAASCNLSEAFTDGFSCYSDASCTSTCSGGGA